MAPITFDELELRRALASEGLGSAAIERVVHAPGRGGAEQAGATEPAGAAGPPLPAPVLGLGAPGLAVLLGTALALGSLAAATIAADEAGRLVTAGLATAYLVAFAIADRLLAARLAPGARAMLALGMAGSAAALAAALVADTRLLEDAAAGDGLVGPQLARVVIAAAAFAVGALSALRLRVPAAWNAAGVLLGLLAISPYLEDDPPLWAVLGTGLALVAVGEIAATVLGPRSATGVTTFGAVVVAGATLSLVDDYWGVAVAGAVVLAIGAVTARSAVIGAGAALLAAGIAVIVAETAGSAAGVALGLAVAAVLVVGVGVALAPARRRDALERRLAPPWRRRAAQPASAARRAA